MSIARRRSGFGWTLLAAPALLGVACNALFGFEDPVHRPDTSGGAAGDTTTGGKATGGSDNGGSAGTSTTGGTSGSAGTDAMGGTSGTPATGGNAGTSGGDAGMGGDSGAATGGSGGASCPEDPTDCEPPDPPSCVGLSVTACAGQSCCASPLVPGCTSCAFPTGKISTVHDFRLDTFETTVGRFRRFVEAYDGPPASGAGEQPWVPGTGWDPTWDGLMPTSRAAFEARLTECDGTPATSTWTRDPGPNEQKPANCMSWYEAFAFCVWDGGFLPTELERTYAAAGGAENRYFPWDDDLDTVHAIWGYCSHGVSTECQLSNILDVGSKPLGVGKYGQHDLTGSMWEWVFDWQNATAWPVAQPCDNCVNFVPPADMARQIRGGSWFDEDYWQPVPYRNATDQPDSVWHNNGIRCAREP